MQKVQSIVLLSSAYTLLLVGSSVLPIWFTIPAGIAITAVIVLLKQAEHSKKVGKILKRLSSLRSEGLFIEGKVKGTEDDVFYHMIMTLLNDLERSLFKLVEKNIQLLSLKEIGRNIISSLDEKKLIDSVFDYLVHGVGYKETAFILLRKKKGYFQAIASIERETRVVRKVINFGFEHLKGAVYNSLVSGKPFLIKDIQMHPLFDVAGESLFPGSTMISYLCVPLMKSGDEIRCFESEDCIIRKIALDEYKDSGDHYLRHEKCLSCPEIPLLGAIIVTDGYRASPLTNIDQVTIETVGSLVSSNIENWILYQDLRQEEIFREKILEGMINGVFVVDLQGNITLANRRARMMSQLELDGIPQVSIKDFIVEDVVGDNKSRILRVLEENVSLTFYEAYLKRSDGIHIPIRMNVSPLMGESGDIQGAIIEFVDLSEIKRMEDEIRHLDRLAVLGRFTSAVAHEIRNPLTGIAAGIQYLNRDEYLSDEHRKNIVFILNEVDRLNRIITDLFKVAKPHKILYQKIEIEELIDRSLKSVSDIFKNKGIDFQKDIDDNLPQIEVDSDQIVQVLINLIKNSLEAVRDGGKIWIKGKIYEGGDTEVIREKDRDMVCIEINDNGPGIAHSDLERIFEPFFSNKEGGTGLGLFITHNIIQHHQGKITVSSNPEQGGTTFRVYLPIAQPIRGG